LAASDDKTCLDSAGLREIRFNLTGLTPTFERFARFASLLSPDVPETLNPRFDSYLAMQAAVKLVIPIIIDDFKDMTIYGKGVKKINLSNQDKGHKEEVKLFLEAIKKGNSCPIPFAETFNAMLATFKVEESISKNGAQVIL
jgi:hypothetical protein